MNSTSAFHTTLIMLGKQYGIGAQFLNGFAGAYLDFFITVFGYSLSCIYFMGPGIPWTKLGFWESRSSIDICSQSSNLPPEYWFSHQDECAALVFGLFENFVIVLASLLWCIVILYASYWTASSLWLLTNSVFAVAVTKRRRKRGSAGRRMQIEYPAAPFPALAGEMLSKPVGPHDKGLQVHDAVKVKDAVSDLGGANSVVQD